ncbi:hypothetical protein HDU92_000782 [Lobulomyces angularis]|nr:hypothetical protein HDU92_000782 [Lobulomyces angularis]
MEIFLYGQVYKDVILEMDKYPLEDTKTRANKVVYRRGGNVANTTVVISKFNVKVNYIGVFAGSYDNIEKNSAVSDLKKRKSINLETSIFRGTDYEEPTAWIIHTHNSRTVINFVDIPELSFLEFKTVVDEAIKPKLLIKPCWFHSEGRNLENLDSMMNYVADLTDNLLAKEKKQINKLIISMEFEKFNRPGLEKLMALPDVLFFSKVYAEGMGFNESNLLDFFEKIKVKCKVGASIFLTWGEKGAYGYKNLPNEKVVITPTKKIIVKDQVGAGDTFIAGMILCLSHDMNMKESLQFAVDLATTKCSIDGFDGLSELIKFPLQ